jgi:hypothetical protein
MQLEEALKRAADSIRAGDYGSARLILIETLRLHPNAEEGWLLLSYALEDPQEKIRCLERVLHLNPDNQLAHQRIAKLRPSPSIPSSGGAQPAQEEAPLARLARTMGAEPELPRAMRAAGRDSAELHGRPAEGETTPREPMGEKLKSKRPLMRGLAIAGGVILVFGVIAGGLYLTFNLIDRAQSTEVGPLPIPTLLRPTEVPTNLPTGMSGVGLPPEWTPTVTHTATSTPPPTTTRTVTLTATTIPPDATTAALMDRIDKEVADIRGLPVRKDVGRYVISAIRVRPILEATFLGSGGSQEELQDEARTLSSLGLIKPTYDLYTNALNGLTDSLGGFYFPWSGELFVIGDRFTGVEHWVYSHEYGHAIVDQEFHIGEFGVYPVCEDDEQRCQAIRALVEGDATLVMYQWWQQYAGPQDYNDIQNYRPPRQTLPEQYPPPYAYRDSEFPYSYGLLFVNYLHERRNWAGVNEAYHNLPASTEQILHPERYVSGEPVIQVSDRELGASLGNNWRLLESNSLGEWTTYLILAYGADISAQMDDANSQAAAEGWGGDHYQVYHNDEADQTVLAAHWVWDTSADQSEFSRLMKDYLEQRFRGTVLNRPHGACWGVNQQVSCIFSSGLETLWLLTPDEETQDDLLVLFPTFR